MVADRAGHARSRSAPTAIARLPGRSVLGTVHGELFVVRDEGAISLITDSDRAIRALAVTDGALWAVGDAGLLVRLPVPSE